MDSDEFRVVLRTAGTDLWGLIDMAILVAARDHGDELRERRDGIVERLYATTTPPIMGRDPILRPKGTPAGLVEEEENGGGGKDLGFSATPDEEEEEYDVQNGDDEKSNVLAIKELLEDPDQEQDEEALVHLLQNLADMDITFKALQETDIGRHVNGLRKHPSGEVRRLVKVVVRKWKDLVDEWVKRNQNETASSAIITDGDSPQQLAARSTQNGNHVPEFGYSPIPHNGGSGLERNSWEPEAKAKGTAPAAAPLPKREPTPTKHHLQAPSSAPPSRGRDHQQREGLQDAERLACARRRLHENYQEAENAKKQRTIQVMEIQDIPKPKNAYFPRNKQQQVNKHRDGWISSHSAAGGGRADFSSPSKQRWFPPHACCWFCCGTGRHLWGRNRTEAGRLLFPAVE